MRSTERARGLGEVFTPESTISEMLDLLQDINYASKFLEPGCGSGNFLVEILARKIQMVSRLPEVAGSLKSGKREELEFKMLIALASIYGIDIDDTNIAESRNRMLETFCSYYLKLTKQKEVPDYLQKAAERILAQNILLGDLINGPHLIEVVDYSELPNNKIKQRVFRFSELIFPADEVFEENDMLFGHVPSSLRDIPALPYRDLANA